MIGPIINQGNPRDRLRHWQTSPRATLAVALELLLHTLHLLHLLPIA